MYPSAQPTTLSRTIPDSFAPQPFNGVVPDAETWLLHFQRYTDYRQMSDDDKAASFPLFLKDSAIDWYDNLRNETKNDFAGTIAQFQSFFCKTAMDHVLDADSVFSRVQRPSERVRDYIAAMQKLARRMPNLDEGILKCMVLRGLRPTIKAYVLQQHGVESLQDIVDVARIAELAGVTDTSTNDAGMKELMDEVRASRTEVQQLASKVGRMTINVAKSRSPTPEYRIPDRRVTFAEPSPSNFGSYNSRRGQFRGTRVRPCSRRPTVPVGGDNTLLCNRCGRVHFGRCVAFNATCYNCGGRGHLRAVCRRVRRSTAPPE